MKQLGRLPAQGLRREVPSSGYYDTVTYIHSDAKLRGFGAAALLIPPSSSSSSTYETAPKYRLACGKGIKNVHIWQFSPPRSAFCSSLSSSGGEGGAGLGALGGGDGSAFAPYQCASGSWLCMYDVATNGNTIHALSFRHGACELLTKSGGSALRVWNLRPFDSGSPGSGRPTYEDVANSQDAKSIAPAFSFGGTYEFAVVRIDAPKEANRDAFAMPEKPCEEDYGNGLRRRRSIIIVLFIQVIRRSYQ